MSLDSTSLSCSSVTSTSVSKGLSEKYTVSSKRSTNGFGGWKTSTNRFIDLVDLKTVSEYWPFLVSGLDELNETCAVGDKVPAEAFFKQILYVVSKGRSFGRVAILVSKSGKPLAFGIVFDNTQLFCRRSAVVFAVYSNRLCATAVKELQDEAERWAVDEGFAELHAVSRRINGATFRIFERQWGFRRTAVIFKKEL